MVAGDAGSLMMVPPAPAVAPVPGVNPLMPYSTMYGPVQPAQVQLIVAVELVTVLAVMLEGTVHAEGAAQAIDASQPGAVTDPSLVKAKVKQPEGCVETNAVPGAICVPHQPPVP